MKDETDWTAEMCVSMIIKGLFRKTRLEIKIPLICADLRIFTVHAVKEFARYQLKSYIFVNLGQPNNFN